MDTVNTIEYKNHTIKVFMDDDSGDSPRDWDNLGTMAFFHRRYNLGDEINMSVEQFKDWTPKQKGIFIPVYMYDHSGISISTSYTYPYNDRWDAGQLGFIYVLDEDIRKEYGCKRISQDLREKARKVLEAEVTIYDQYLRGEVYGVCVYDGEEQIDGCWGYYDLDYGIDEAKAFIDWHLDNVYHQMEIPVMTECAECGFHCTEGEYLDIEGNTICSECDKMVWND